MIKKHFLNAKRLWSTRTNVVLASTIVLAISTLAVMSQVQALSNWSQTDWGGGQSTGAVTGSVTTYDSQSNINTSVAGQLSLSDKSDWASSLSNWSQRIKITIDHTKVSQNLTDFPVYLDLASFDNTFFSSINNGGSDIRVTDSTGSQIPREIVTVDKLNKNGEIYFKAPSLSSTADTVFYVYFDSPSAAEPAANSAYGSQKVWSNGYKFVYHMNSATNSVDGSIGNLFGGIVPGDQTGKIGKATYFSGSGQYINAGTNPIAGSNPFTLYARISTAQLSNYSGAVSIGSSATNASAYIGTSASSQNGTNNSIGGGLYGFNIGSGDQSLSTWKNITLSYDSIAHMYVNGIATNNASVTPNLNPSGPVNIGRIGTDNSYDFAGLIDEVRISNVTRSASWIAVQNSNQTTPATFYTVTPSESNYAPSGVLTSNIFDTSYASDWGAASYNYTGSGTVEVRVRTSNNATMTGASAWSSCDVIFSNIDISSNNCVHDTDRYAQYQVTLKPAEAATPIFQDFTLSYDPSDLIAPDTNASSITMNTSPSGRNISAGSWDNSPNPYFAWSPGTDNPGGSGVKGYCLYLGSDNTADPLTTKGLLGTSPLDTKNTCPFAIAGNSIDLSQSGLLAGSMISTTDSYYLRIKVIDNSNNVYSGSAAQFNFRFDNDDPNPPAFITAPSNFIANKDVTLTWNNSGPSAPSDDTSGLAGLQYRIGENGTWYGDIHDGSEGYSDLLANDGSYQTDSAIDYSKLQEGNNIIYMRAVDVAHNISAAYVTTVVKINTTSPSQPLSVSATPSINTQNSFAFSWIKPLSFAGSASNLTYCYTINTLPSANTCQFTSAGQTSLPADAFATQPGNNTFYVVAKDEAGNINYATYGQVNFTANTSAPGIPRNVSIADISIRATARWKLALSWEAPSSIGAGVHSYKIYRSPDDSAGSYVNIASNSGTSYVDSDLLQQTYYYKIMACDSANNCSALSASVHGYPTGRYTVPASLLDGPTTSNITTRTATISWVTDRPSSSAVSLGTKSNQYSASEVSNSDQLTVHSIDLVNLEPGTTYYFKAKWTDEDGNTGSSNERMFTTLPAPTVRNVKAVDIGLSNSTIKFTSEGAVQVKVYFGKGESFGGLQSINTSSKASDYSIELNGLDDGTTYYFKLNPVDSGGHEYQGTVLSFETPARPRISSLQFQPVNGQPTSTQKITWITNVPTNSLISYGIVDQGSKEIIDSKLTTKHELTISNLQDNSRYQLVAKSQDSSGNLATSDTQFFRTALDTRPPEISNTTVETKIQGDGDGARGQIIISWSTDEPATSQVAYSQGTGGGGYDRTTAEDSQLTTEHIVVISDLATAQAYHLQPISHDKSNNIGKGDDNSAIIGRASEGVLGIIITTIKQLFGL